MRLSLRSQLFLLVFTLGASPAFAQPGSNAALTPGITGQAAATRWLDSFRQSSPKPALLILETRGGEVPAGMRMLHSLGQNYRLVYVEPVKQKLSGSVPVSAVYPVTPAMKLAPELRAAKSGTKDVMIEVLPGSGSENVRELVSALGGTLTPAPLTDLGYFEASLPASAIQSLAASTQILHIGPKAVDRTLNFESRRTTKANVAAAPISVGGWNLNGEGITIGVGDNVPGLFHVDLRDRIINYNPASYANHGQHVNGTVGGAGIMDPLGEGFAPQAMIVDHLYNLVWQNVGAMRSAHNMRVTNNSYANVVGDCNAAGRYDVYAQILDTLSLQYPDVLHVFASGNDGGSTCTPFPTGYATVTGGYQAAKNVLVVGNATKFNTANPGTSRGPIRDGRLKPEIAAVGSSTWSTRGNDTYGSASGTSMACPEISGIAGLLQQRYKQTHNGAYPASALLKSLLMNGALDIGRPGPDFEFGFGMADMKRSLLMMDSSRYATGTIANGANQSPLTISVPAGAGQLKVMLYWHDVAASMLAATQLVNDLDLRVTTPGNVQTFPLVLNPGAASVTDPAVPGADHLNNVEQVVITNPAAGTYTVNVAGYSVPQGSQAYTVVYDILPAGIDVTCPLAGEVFKNGDPILVTWNATPGTNDFSVEYSDNNGASWNTLTTNVPATDRLYFWTTPTTVNSAQCIIRVTRNGTGEQFTTGAFTLAQQPVLQLAAAQCPGYVSLTWNATPNATGYNVLRKIGPFLRPVQTVSGTSYTASGLTPDSLYYFAVEPVFGTARAFRSKGLSRVPNSGNCAGTISDNDLRISGIISPASGRLNTSSALSASENLQIAVQNLDDAPVASYQLAYQVNGGPWTTQAVAGIAAGTTATASFTGLNLTAPGTYVIRTAVTNLSAPDPVPQNDTFTRTVRQLQNTAIVISSGFSDDFESLDPIELRSDSMGFTSNERWDFYNSNDTGRLRSSVNPSITIGGDRSISMDMVQNMPASFNRLTGTFNLATAVAGTDEIRVEFDYKLHGRSKTADSNRVWVRGNDTQPWRPLFTYSRTAVPGQVYKSGTLSVSDALIAASQSFSSSTQIAFGQFDTSVIAHNEFGNGMTLDNFKLYSVSNDAGIAGVISPTRINCGLGTSTPLTIAVTNGVAAALTNVKLFYQLDGGPVMRDSIASLSAKSTVPFTFAYPFDASAPGAHMLRVWVEAIGDSYRLNDSVTNFVFRNQPLIATYPYLQDFEGGDGYWFAEGQNSSWQFGTPAGQKIHKAASGTKAWKTSLSANYNDNERSYLYSPCFSLSGLTTPMLSFSMAAEIEDCGTSVLCDGAWLEYSLNDTVWTKIGAAGQGTNWYNSSSFQIWNSQTGYRWKVASIPLPTGLSQPVRLRFVMFADPGTSFEGLAIDDIHIYDRSAPIYAGGALGPVTQPVSSGGFTAYSNSGSVIAQLNPGAGSLGNTDLTVYAHSSIINAPSSQYFLPRSFVINTQNTPTDSILTRLYIPDADVLTLVNATGCSNCSKPEDAYELGVTKYDNTNTAVENGSLSDNIGGQYVFIPYSRVRWVPYDAGYYAEFKVNSFSELWFNSGGAGNAFPLPLSSVEFTARKISDMSVLTSWMSHIDTQVSGYELQRSDNGIDFNTISRKPAIGNNDYAYSYIDLIGPVNVRAFYYRLQYTLRNGKIFYTPTRQIIWSGRSADIIVTPNPTADGKLQLDWSTQQGEELSVVVTDVTGRVVRTFKETAGTYANRSYLDLGPEPKGIYMLQATLSGEKFTFKVTRL
jgi:hypothetical protein